MRLKVADSVVAIPGPRLHIHNVSQGDRNRNQQDKLAVSTDLNSTQWASNYVTSPHATLLKDHLTNNGSNFNSNITASLQQQQLQQQHLQQQQQRRTSYSASSDLLSESSPDDSLGDYDADAAPSSSSLDASPQGDEYRCFSHDDLSDSDSLSDDGNCHSGGDVHPCAAPGRGIVNPNYPGFQHLAHRLQHSDIEDLDDDVDVVDASDNNNLYNNNNNNNNNGNDEEDEGNAEDVTESKIDSINHKDSVENFQKAFYDKPKFDIPVDTEDELVSDVPVSDSLQLVNDLNVPVVDVVDSSAEVENLGTSVLDEGDLGIDEENPGGGTECVDQAFIESVFADIENLVTALDDVNAIEYSVAVPHSDQVFAALSIEETRVNCVTKESGFVSQDNASTALHEEELLSNLDTKPWADEDFVDIVLSEAEEILNTSISEKEHFVEQSVEDIETAFSDVELNETIFADLESIKTAFADNGIFNCNKICDSERVIPAAAAFLKHPFESAAQTKDIILAERDDSVSVSPAMAATATTTPLGEPKQIPGVKMEDAFLSNVKEDLPGIDVLINCNPTNNAEKKDRSSDENILHGDSNRVTEDREKFMKEDQSASEKEKDEDSVVPRKKEKMEINYNVKKIRHSIGGGGGGGGGGAGGVKGVAEMTLPLNMTAGGGGVGGVVRRREFGPRGRDIMLANRRSMPVGREKKRASQEALGGFDVYNIETAMPKIDLDAIESHLKAAREEDRRRRNDREEIRKRLAMGSDADEYYGGERLGRKPSLQARLQSGMNLQICFMNETVSDTESPGSDTEPSSSPSKHHIDKTAAPRSYALPKSPNAAAAPGTRTRPSTSMLTLPLRREPDVIPPMTEADFFARQARLQAEARMALAQAKEMAHMQMEIERQRQKKSPITEMVRSSLEKVGIPFPEDRRRVSRQILTEMNLAQLQVIVNDLHTQIEVLNESLVKFLMNRDDLHMEQDSMLVDIEDLTRYLGAKEQPMKDPDQPQPLIPQNGNLLLLTNKPKLNRIAGMVKK